MTRTWIVALLLLALPTTLQAQAPEWPARPLRILVPFVPGSFGDVSARALANELTAQLGQPVIVDHRTGAGGTIAFELVARATPDGYTLLVADNSFAIASSLYSKPNYDPVKDFAHVTPLAESPSMMLARLKLPAKTLKELASLARARPGELTFGSGGQGSSAHLAMELFLNVAGAKMLHVPFKGVAAALTELVADRLDATIASLATGAPLALNERAQGLAVSGKERNPLLPAVPTFAEAGFPRYNMSFWWSVAVPKGTPPATVARLNREIARAAGGATLKDIFQKQGARAVTSSPAEHTRRLAEEVRTWQEVIAKANVKIE